MLMLSLFFFVFFLSRVACETHVWLPGDERDFVLMTLPDTQWEDADSFEQQTDWICQYKDLLRIAYVAHLGDVVDDPTGEEREWNIASASMQTLTDCGLAWSVLPGNHDLGPVTDYDTNFPASLFDASGSFPPGSGRNTYRLLTVHNAVGWSAPFLFLSIGYLPWADAGTVAWAQSIMDTYSDRQAVIFTHAAGDDCSAMVDNNIVSLLVLHCNALFVASGHSFACGGENEIAMNKAVRCPGGGFQFALTSDYQGRPDGGEGWLRYYRFTYSLTEIYSCVPPHTRRSSVSMNRRVSVALPFLSRNQQCRRPGRCKPMRDRASGHFELCTEWLCDC